MVKGLMEGVTEWKESVAVYIAWEFSHICFSLHQCSCTFLGEKPEHASRGEPPLRLWKGWPGLAQDSPVSTCSQAPRG